MCRADRRSAVVALLAVGLLAAACSDGDTNVDGGRSEGDEALVAQVASFDVVAGSTGRFIVGLFGSDRTETLAFGTVTFQFAHLDEGGGSSEPDEPVTASYLPIPGQEIDPDQPGPRLVGGAEATGVYGAPEVTFDQAGFWEVTVTATLDGNNESATAAFEVQTESDIPTVGDTAPRTVQPLAGSADVDPNSIDSRASAEQPVPDPELHDLTLAAALDAGRPVIVVVSTPTFCVSRFCGPITDSVQDLADDFTDTPMAFVHLEVWQDYEANILNPAAREWIAPTPETDGGEPWVFVVDADGIITHRFDNVATDAELLEATQQNLSP